MRKISTLLAAVAGLAVAAVAAVEPPSDPGAALGDGNRLFRDGHLEAAVAAYLEGATPDDPHPTLFYNLGTALHHTGRLPEAILWYRRAAAAGAGDPWLQDNLWLARRGLGSQGLPAGGTWGWLGARAGGLRLAAVAAAWVTLLLVVADRRIPVQAVAAAALAAGSLYLGAAAVERWGPQPAVVLEDCLGAGGALPAGTEVWVLPAPGVGWRISGAGDAACPPGAVEPVFRR